MYDTLREKQVDDDICSSTNVVKIKGVKNGLCNRTACQSPTGVVCFNDSTRAYYCEKCAELINDVNYVDNRCKNLCHIEDDN